MGIMVFTSTFPCRTKVEELGTFVDDGEKSLLQDGIAKRIRDAQRALELCEALLSTGTTQDTAAFIGHNLPQWRSTLLQLTQGHLTAVQTVTVNALFASLTQQKALKSPDWAEVLEKAIDLSSLVE